MKPIAFKPRDTRDYVKGVSSIIPYIVRVENGDWSQYFSQYIPQRYGMWDTDDCWDDSSISSLEAQLNYLVKTGQMPQVAINWYQDNGYIGIDGLFRLSPRFIGIISGVTDNGNNPWNFCLLAKKYGFLPFSDLNYSDAQASKFSTKQDFDNDYFNPQVITAEMYTKAKQALQWVNIQFEWIGKDYVMPELQEIKAAQCQSPLIIALPIPVPGSLWNQVDVPYTGGKNTDHCVCLESVPIDNTFLTRDNYRPFDKILAANYYIPQVINMIITAQPLPATPNSPVSTTVLQNPVKQNWWNIVWQNVFSWWNK